ncbi:MAG: hypothetical protein ABI178_13895 [Rhodanobacter sp.]
MNPVPRTAMAFLLASLLATSTFPLTSPGATSLLVFLAGSLALAAVLANAREPGASGTPIGLTGGRVLPVAGLNFAALLTFLVIALSLGTVVTEALAA